MEYLREAVFYVKFNEVDSREPLFQAGRLGITGIITVNPLFLTQLVILCTMTQVVCFSVAAAAYFGIVVPRRNRQKEEQHTQETVQSCLFGYGILLPVLVYFPFWLIETLSVQNCMLLLTVVGCPVLSTMRLIETLHARRMPLFTQNNLWYFCLYFALPMVLDHDSVRPVKATTAQLRSKLVRTLSVFIRASIVLSLLAAYDFHLFPARKPITSVSDLVFWGNLANNYVAASVVSLTLDASCAFGEIVLSLLTGGMHFIDSHESPMTRSTSVSGFWGRRWNKLVGDSLKRGVFGPLRRFLPRSVAAVLTFLTSGLAHEYMLFVLSEARKAGGHGSVVIANNLLRQPYQHQLGHQFGFFVYNGILLILEELWRDRPGLVWIQKNVPGPIRTFLVMFLVVPFTHFFTDEYDECGIFRDVAMAFPRFRYDISRTPLINSTLINSTAYMLSSQSSMVIGQPPENWEATWGNLLNLDYYSSFSIAKN